ncbi:uncharacterized protein LOC135683769 isoform X2 [Rhopilema esculentum]|uniref:uncharacterized protein LOC135683769 isoform X2 n=1 Tax=Rhopilema esculentum TaxID=499914 RepID=UPI0031D05B1C
MIYCADNQKALFNPNCKTAVLLDDIKKRCQCHDASILDVSDEKGEIKYLQDHIQDYATEILKGREILILLEMSTNKETKEVTYLPLLKNMKKLYPNVIERWSNTTNNNEDQANDANQKTGTTSQRQRHASQSNSLQPQQRSKKLSMEHPRRRANSDRSPVKSLKT